MAGIALKGQCNFASIMVPPEVSAASSRSLMGSSVAAFRILIKYIWAFFLRLEIFKEFVLNLLLEAVEIS